MRQRAVVFDLGGVLVDWNPRHLYRKLFDDEVSMEAFLADVCSPAWNEQQDAGRSWAEAVAELSSRHPQHAALIGAYRERWEEMLKGPIEGSVAILEELHAAGTPLYALTNWSAETFPIARGRFAFLHLFRDILVSGEVKLKKPDPRIFALLMDRFGLEPRSTVFIDDSEPNVVAAAALGIDAIRFVDPERLRFSLRERGLI